MSKNICIDCKKISLEPVEVQDHGNVCQKCAEQHPVCDACQEHSFTLDETNYSMAMCNICIEATYADDKSFRVVNPDAWKGERL